MARLAKSLSALALALLAACAPSSTSAEAAGDFQFKGTPPLVIKGYRFFDSSTGAHFGARGVNYYPRPNTGKLDANNLDLFTRKFAHLRERDFPRFEELGANAIRLYAVDPDADHSPFMCELQARGIYVVVDLGSSCAGCEITPVAPPACYPKSYKERGEKIIREFARYDNVMAFSGGNEVNHRSASKNASDSNAPCQKMFVRDMRNFIAAHKSAGMRQVPVGLVVADTERVPTAQYYNCETSSLSYERAEWYGLNTYIQCDDISDPTKAAGFNGLRTDFAALKYSIPVVLTEFGCTSERFPTVKGYKGQRTFHDALWMNSRGYTEYFAGGFAFEYSTENANSKSTSKFPFTEFGPQNYGLGYLDPESCDDVTSKCSFVPMPNFYSLAAAYKATDTSGEPTLTTFKPAADRTAANKCPAGYPSIGDFKWEGGVNPLLKFSAESVKRFQCPTTLEGLKALQAKESSPEAGIAEKFEPQGGAQSMRSAGSSAGSSAGKKNSGGSNKPTPTPTPSKATPATNDAESAMKQDPASSEPGSGSSASSSETKVRSTSAAPRASTAVGSLVALLAIGLALLLNV